jgi:hypothetical protein
MRDLIRRMRLENPLWGATKIHGELLKLGFQVSLSFPKNPSGLESHARVESSHHGK